MAGYRYLPAGAASGWTTLALTDATEQDDSGSKDSGTTDLANRVIGWNATASLANSTRSALGYYWPIEIPARARNIILRIPVVTLDTHVSNQGIRFALLDSTTQSTSEGAMWNLTSNGTSAMLMGATEAWAALSNVAAGSVTPSYYRAGGSLYYSADSSKWQFTSSMITAVDTSGESSNVHQRSSLDDLLTLTDSSGGTAYLYALVHSIGPAANTATLSAEIQYQIIVDP